MALVARNAPANAGDIRDVGSTLGQEGPLEEGLATHSSILAWRVSWTEQPGRPQSLGTILHLKKKKKSEKEMETSLA